MVKSESRATDNYRQGVQRIGIDAYQQAAQANTPKEAAEILENAKSQSLSVSDFADAYSRAYS